MPVGVPGPIHPDLCDAIKAGAGGGVVTTREGADLLEPEAPQG
jgi:hypothetical protein